MTSRWEISTCVFLICLKVKIWACVTDFVNQFRSSRLFQSRVMNYVDGATLWLTFEENTPLLFVWSLGCSDRVSVSFAAFCLSPLSGHGAQRLSVAWCPSWPSWTDCLDLVASILTSAVILQGDLLFRSASWFDQARTAAKDTQQSHSVKVCTTVTQIMYTYTTIQTL